MRFPAVKFNYEKYYNSQIILRTTRQPSAYHQWHTFKITSLGQGELCSSFRSLFLVRKKAI